MKNLSHEFKTKIFPLGSWILLLYLELTRRICGLIFQALRSSETDNKSKYSFSSLRFSTKHALKSHPLDPWRISEIADWRLLPFDLILSPADWLGISMKKTISFSVEIRQVLQCKNMGFSHHRVISFACLGIMLCQLNIVTSKKKKFRKLYL